MPDETVIAGVDSAPKPKRIQRKKLKAVPQERGQSTIAFPYQDLENGISVVRAILGSGGVAVTRDQLAGVMGLSATSGNFVLKVATARMFGLINNVGGKYELSPIGFDIVDAARQRAARATAFLTVPLYKRVYDEFKGRQLPPRPHGLENAFLKFGVAPKQCATARQVFDKSASQAGFFPSGPERLIEPIIGAAASVPGTLDLEEHADVEVPDRAASRGFLERVGPTLHPFVQGLLDTLPEANTNWTIEGRAKWLQAAAHCFDLIYKGSGDIKITASAAEPTRPALHINTPPPSSAGTSDRRRPRVLDLDSDIPSRA